MTAMVGPSCQEMFPSGVAESRVPNRADRAAVRGDDEIKQQNSRVPICVEALLLHNSDRKSHYRRIIAALSLWVLRVVIHSIRPPLFSFSLIRSLLNTLESESILVLFLSGPFCYTSWMCGPSPAGQQMRSLIVHIQISRVGDYWEDELDWVRSLWSQRQDKESLCHLVLVMHLFVSWYCSDRKHENFLQHRWMMLSCCIHSCPTLPVQLSGSSVRSHKCTSQTCCTHPSSSSSSLHQLSGTSEWRKHLSNYRAQKCSSFQTIDIRLLQWPDQTITILPRFPVANPC